MEEEILEKSNELYDLLSKFKENIESSSQYWSVVETQNSLGLLMQSIGG